MTSITIGSNEYEVYSDVAEADAYYNGSTEFADWDALTATEKSRALVSSTRLIDRQPWQGAKVVSSPDQILDFPRTGLVDCEGIALDDVDTLPLAVTASQLLALDIHTDNAQTQQRINEDLTKSLKAGSVSLVNFRQDKDTLSGRFALDVMELIGCFLSSGASISSSIDSGTDGVAVDNDFGFTEGF